MLIAGVDEAGRGPLAGPVVAAAVIWNPLYSDSFLQDSKKLSANKREQYFKLIIKQAIAFAISEVSVPLIDEINILQATLKAMQEAVNKLKIKPNKVLIDGNKAPKLPHETVTIIKGDQLVPTISAASILAKVTRDKILLDLDKKYPQYGFAKHKGYPTKEHLAALTKYGPCACHRTSYAPVKRAIFNNSLLSHEY